MGGYFEIDFNAFWRSKNRFFLGGVLFGGQNCCKSHTTTLATLCELYFFFLLLNSWGCGYSCVRHKRDVGTEQSSLFFEEELCTSQKECFCSSSSHSAVLSGAAEVPCFYVAPVVLQSRSLYAPYCLAALRAIQSSVSAMP